MIIQRYLLAQYFKVQFFCVISFIAILLTTRLKEIAQFATLGAERSTIFWFACYQIPYILPIAIPIACLISSIVLIQHLSASHELTALRVSGKSLRAILAPILYSSLILAAINFYVVSEMATQSHLETRKLEHKLREINPLFLLQNKHLSKIKGFYINAEGHSGEKANNLLIAFWSKHNQRIHLMSAQELLASESLLIGKTLTFLTTFQAAESPSQDNILIENVKQSTTSSEEFSQLLKKNIWRFHNDYLRLPLLWVHIHHQWAHLNEAKQRGDAIQIKQLSKNLNSSFSEIFRRTSIALAAFTFTLMGAAFGMTIGRYQSQKGAYYVVGLATFYLICFFSAKRLEGYVWTSAMLYIVPHIIIMLLSIRALYRVSRGME